MREMIVIHNSEILDFTLYCEWNNPFAEDFSPFLVNTTQLYQPLISFLMEDDEKNRWERETSIYYDDVKILRMTVLLIREYV